MSWPSISFMLPSSLGNPSLHAIQESRTLVLKLPFESGEINLGVGCLRYAFVGVKELLIQLLTGSEPGEDNVHVNPGLVT